MKHFIIIFLLFFQFLWANDNYYYSYNKKESLTKLSTIQRANAKLDYYQTSKGAIVGISNRLILKLKNNKNLAKYRSDFNLTMIEVLSKDMYLLQTKNKSLTIDTSNRLSEKEDVEYAHPDFIQKRIMR